MLNRIFSILSAQWLIHQDTAISYLPVLVAFIRGQEFVIKNSDESKPYVVAFMNQGQPVSTVGPWSLDDPSMQENSIAVLPVEGPLTSWDLGRLMSRLKAAENNPNINGVILMINSPGGMVSQLDLLAGTIKSLTKPTVSVISGMAASAAMWIASATNYRIATSKIDLIGSVGVKTSIQDYSGLLEKIGIKITDFYATKSTRKDEQDRAFTEDGNKQPIIDLIDFINEVFHSAIAENLGIKADSEVFTGAIFFAEKAKELGLINEINTLDYSLNYAYQLGLKHKIINQSKSLKF